ncbi:hypothetical protein BT63DRAFT_456879 [Microthyrium microscopicum]|uniref:HMG box domain-containing protein n=1 Tax=Microthyrium microscopicum TaxID=703497 RepID=A0A6A6U815_9PEZI|nr:hypothetical protein BT63DRAFT_456879 [Microthyrium microscopicum]
MPAFLARVGFTAARSADATLLTRSFNALPQFQRTYIARNLARSLAIRTIATAKPKAGRRAAPTKKRVVAAKKTVTTTKNAVVKKTKAKAKAKPKPKKKVIAKKKPAPKKRVLSELQKAKIARTKVLDEIKTLRAKTLTPPPRKPITILAIFAQQQKGSKMSIVDMQAKFKALTADQREELDKQAQHNKKENELDSANWILQYTPEQIKEANSARKLLRRRVVQAYPKRKAPTTRNILYSKLKDDRQPKRPLSAWTMYLVERRSGEAFASSTTTEALKLIAKEWKEMSVAEKKQHQDLADADKLRYQREFKAAYGYDKPPSASSRASSASA